MKRLSVFLGGLIMSISAEGLAAGWQTFYNPDGTKWTQAQYQGINGSTFPVVGGGSLTATARINSTKDAVCDHQAILSYLNYQATLSLR